MRKAWGHMTLMTNQEQGGGTAMQGPFRGVFHSLAETRQRRLLWNIYSCVIQWLKSQKFSAKFSAPTYEEHSKS